MTDTPALNLVVFMVVTVVAILLFWPRFGLVPRVFRQRLVASRVRIEDALKHVYHHQSSGRTASVASLGGALQTKPATVVTLVQRMQQAGLLRLTDGRILLTDEGERYALQVIRAHRLWERYLADRTGVDPREWHASADRYEHRITPERADALAAQLGDPRIDPHGDPIPTADGEIPEQDDRVTPLSELGEGVPACVVHVEDEPEVVFAQILAHGVYPGNELTVLHRDDLRIVFESEGSEVTLAPVVAANVSVRPLRDGRREHQTASRITLADVSPGQRAEIVRISEACRGIERRRLMDLGLVPGTAIELERPGMTGGASAYRVRGTLIALRREQAQAIGVELLPDAGADDSRREAS
jgi:DtxR family Mn-dependent transcriptional regulator